MATNQVWNTPNFGANMPEYAEQAYGYNPQQVQAQGGFDPYAQAGKSAGAVNQMYQGLGIKGPHDYREQAYAGLNQQLSGALTAAAAGGARGGVAGSMQQPALAQFAGAGAQLESNYANQLQQYDMARQHAAMGYGNNAQQAYQFGAGQNMQAQMANQQAGIQNAQYGANFGADQALQAYQNNQLSPWEFDAMLRLQGGTKEARRMQAGMGGGEQPVQPSRAYGIDPRQQKDWVKYWEETK